MPRCFIILCRNTAIAKLVDDYVSGFTRTNDDGSSTVENGRLALFRNFEQTTKSTMGFSTRNLWDMRRFYEALRGIRKR